MKRIAIVGGGVSGLATAYSLDRQLEAAGLSAEMLIFESQPKPGGTMRTIQEQGFFMESGPNGFLTNKPHALDLARELGLENRLQKSSGLARKRFVFSRGRLHRLPETPGAFLGCRLLSPGGRLRVLAEPFVRPGSRQQDESVAQFASRRLGQEAMEKLIEPMTAGVFAGNPDQLSLRSCFPRIHELESRYGGLIKAMLALRGERRRRGVKQSMSAGPGGVLTSFDAGVEVLIDSLAGCLAKSLRLNAAVEAVSRCNGKYLLSVRENSGSAQCEADAVVLATPAHAAGRLLGVSAPELGAELERIPYVPVAVVALGFDAAALSRPWDGFGFLVPRKEGRGILGALWDSSVFEGRAPAGKALVRVMVGGARQPELARLTQGELLALVREELRGIMGIKAEPVLSRVFFHEQGIPQYLVGHGQVLERLNARLAAWPGFYLNSNAYRGVSLNDCIRESKLAAQSMLKVIE
ncbi:MAG TPA: protoporphyrinogen oxidase [Elusimicrobia bacterium]|nr:protoporphyrinogen oxidase [Elusimicrobiota bacterium]HBT62893.1 protoporphyrinogen oxidase [Elusimicrobiota bacterium]